jgi:outer membrane biosynthesis protein TonB
LLRAVDNSKYFIIGGIISFLFFFIILGAFFYMMFYVNSTKTYGLKKDKFISISLKDIKTKPRIDKKKSSKKQKKVKKKILRKKIDTINEDLDVDSLFDNVWTKKISTKKRKKKVDAKRIQEIEKSLDLDSKLSDISKNNSDKKTSQNAKTENEKTSSGEEVNKYLAKIHAIVYDYFYPPANSEGNVVVAVLELSALGKVTDFRILNYSGNEALNDEVDKIKQRIKNVIFPKNPQNKSQRIIIKLIPEDKE